MKNFLRSGWVCYTEILPVLSRTCITDVYSVVSINSEEETFCLRGSGDQWMGAQLL